MSDEIYGEAKWELEHKARWKILEDNGWVFEPTNLVVGSTGVQMTKGETTFKSYTTQKQTNYFISWTLLKRCEKFAEVYEEIIAGT